MAIAERIETMSIGIRKKKNNQSYFDKLKINHLTARQTAKPGNEPNSGQDMISTMRYEKDGSCLYYSLTAAQMFLSGL